MRYPHFIDGSYEVQSIMADVQRTVNLYPQIVESEGGKNAVTLMGTPGLSLHRDLGSASPIRGIDPGVSYIGGSYYFHCFSGSGLYRVEAVTGASSTKMQTIADDTYHTPVAACPGGNVDLFIVSAGVAYQYTCATDTFAAVANLAGKVCIGAVYLDGYNITAVPAEGKYYISGLNDSTNWNLLDYGAPNLYAGIGSIWENHGELWLQGGLNTEVHYDSGDTDFPFQRIPGSRFPQGSRYPYSVAICNNAPMWIGLDVNGGSVVWKADNYLPVRVSNHAVEKALNAYVTSTSVVEKVRAWTFKDNGHEFYVLNIDTDVSWVYDALTGRWFEWAYYTAGTGLYSGHLGRCHSFINNTHMVGSRVDGKIYKMASSYYDDAGDPIKRMRRAPHLADEGKVFTYSNFQLDMETGIDASVGATGVMTLRYSNDGGKTYSTPRDTAIGATGAYKTRALWRRLGSARDRVFEVYSVAPIPHCWTDAFINHLGVQQAA